MLNVEPKYIIAIGASAGGMEEINSFFDNTPVDGVTYIIVQHLSADFKSRMAELLARHSRLEIIGVENGMHIKSNKVYLIPNDKFMTIEGGHLFLTGKGAVKGPHLTINTFFIALAKDCGNKAIGIIFSGMGSDGTDGIKAIKNKGGMVMVRTPESSEFPSMPENAIATGMVDFVLEPGLMPSAIKDYVQRENDVLADDMDDIKNIGEIIELIRQKSPLDFTDYKQSTILRRTKRRMVQKNLSNLSVYLEVLKENSEELNALTKEFLISVTSFFRNPDAFEYINEKIIPDLLGKLIPGEELKMWVAGCATGEEVYSLAIIIAEHLKGKYKDVLVKIFATDIDTVALAYAAKGIYNSDCVKDVSPDRLDNYFLKEANLYRVKPSIRKMVIFAKHDLVKNPPYCNMHLISCRNLLIYMTPVLQKKIFSMLLFGMKMDGYLFLGSSESPAPIMNSLDVVHKKWKIYRNIKNKQALNFDTFSIPGVYEVKHQPSTFLGNESLKSNNQYLSEFMCNEVSKETNTLYVFVNEHNEVIKSYGDPRPYLLQENFNFNLEELLYKPLAVAFKNLSILARKKNEKVSVSGIKIINDTHIKLSIVPLPKSNASQGVFMVIFKTDHDDIQIDHTPVYDKAFYEDKYTENLEYELKDLKNTLYAAHEQLNASNENMQSFNEELISANEEMQSTNEEMQSVNEELHTINADYQLKNKELSEINDDLNNYFRSNINGQLFIDKDMRLMKFSPNAVNLINLMETDIGRPLNHISTNIKFENIIDDIEKVLVEDNVISKQIETTGRWYQMMIMPYLREANKKGTGAIITFSDITELKSIQFELDQKNQSLLRINADLDHFIHAASHDLLAPLGNIETSINVMNQIALSDERLVDVLNMINRSIKTYRLLITDISIIAKIESDMNVMEMVSIDEVIKNIEWSLEDKIQLSGARIILDLGMNTIRFSKKNLRSILFNLISNAIKFRGPADPVIQIKTAMEGENFVLTVQDNGKGIDKAGLEKIFEMYGRLHQNIEGSGIGLYLAKKIVNAAGGRLLVESEIDKGTKFTIFLKMQD